MEGLVQIGPYSFLDEGVDGVIRVTRDKARLSGLIVFTYSFSKSLVYRSPFDVEGRATGPEYQFNGGMYFRPHLEHYKDTAIEAGNLHTKDEPFKGTDILEQVIGPCHDAGLRVYAALPLGREPASIHDLAPAFRKCSEVDAWGKPVGEARPHGWQERAFVPHCYNNPDYRAFYRGLVKDQLSSYALDGLLILPDERYGPIEKVLIADAEPTCFCAHCIQKGKERGIDVEAAKAGFKELCQFAAESRNENYVRSSKGHLSKLLEFLLRYPEIMAWERLWYETVEDFMQDLYSTSKAVRKSCSIGMHVWQVASWGIIARAETRLERLAESADWLKPVLYDIPGGTRLVRTYGMACHQSILRDLDFEEAIRFLQRVMGQPPAENSRLLEKEGLGPEYVTRETARAAEAVKGKALVYPGLGVDVEPNAGLQYPEQRPEDVKAAVKAATKGGAEGFVLSINYAQMHDRNLAAVGRALADMS